MNEPSTTLVKVWDPFVRFGHWLMVITFFIAYFLEDKILPLHVWCGYVLGLVVVLRAVWGFVGPRRARFTDFICRPWTAITYFFDLISLRSKRYVGYSPAGGVMIVALLVTMGAVVYSGPMIYALDMNRGPLAPFVIQTPAIEEITGSVAAGATQGDQSAATATEWKKSDNPDARARRRLWDRLHRWLSNLTMILIAMHIGGVALASYAHRENLVLAMFITGKKRPEAKT
jgi:cytochrome b